MNLIKIEISDQEPLRRSVSLTNEQWAVVTMCIESYSETWRTRNSQTIATYVTRGQLQEAVNEADKMSFLLQQLDEIYAQIV